MTLIINLLIGCVIFGYVGFTLYKSIKKQKAGKCASCALQKDCSTSTCIPSSKKIIHK